MSKAATYTAWEQQRLPDIDITPNRFEFYCLSLGLTEEQLIGKRVLDIGAGASDFTARVNELGGFAVAIDLRYGLTPTNELVDEVRTRLEFQNFGALDQILSRFSESIARGDGHYICSGLSMLPFRNNSFDLVVSNQLLYKHILGAPMSADASLHILGEILRVTKPRGKIKDWPAPETPAPVEQSMIEHVLALASRFRVMQAEQTKLTKEDKEDIKRGNLYCVLQLALRGDLIELPRFLRVKGSPEENLGYMMQITKRETRGLLF